MLIRRSVLQGLAASLLVPTLGVRRGRTQSATGPRLHAMIVGINAYSGRTSPPGGPMTPILPLHGAINDARAIESAVRPLAASVRVLLDGDVSRAAFFNAWRQMVGEAAEGDVMLVTYSGHGGQEPGPAPSSAPDGMHDTFIMPTLDTSKAGLNEERILDDEIQGLWKSVQGRNKIIFVADSCHAGGMTRAVNRDAAALGYRTVFAYDNAGPHSRGLKIPSAPSNLQLPHVVFLSGAQHSELVPEILIEGRPQGALSWSFANALRGAGDANHDGVITGAELSSSVLRAIRNVSDSAQHPAVRWPQPQYLYERLPQPDVRSGVDLRPNDPLIYLAARSPAPAPVGPSNALRLQIRGMDGEQRQKIETRLNGVRVVGPGETAEISWDAVARESFDQFGNVVASGVGTADLQAVVDGARAVEAVRSMVLKDGLDMRLLLPGEAASTPPSVASDRTHVRGTHLSLVVTGLRFPYLIVLNIAGDGTVQFLYPLPERGDPARVDPAVAYRFPASEPITVLEPFGGDHAIAIASAQELPALIAALRKLDQRKAAADAAAALTRYASGAQVQAGMQGIFTRAK
jgi:hypothetical protein